MLMLDERDLAAALQPIRPYLGDLVLCSGWTLLIYRRWVVKECFLLVFLWYPSNHALLG